MNKILILSIILWIVKHYVALATLACQLDNDENYKCAEAVIKELECSSLTLVNFEDDIKLAKNLHKAMKYKIILRQYLDTKINVPNEAYTVLCKNIKDCIEGLQDLVKDRYWNPNTTFCFIMKATTPQDTEKLFEKLHNLNVFKTVILNNGNMYLYDFQIGNHCVFTPQAISKYECKWLYESHNSTLSMIRQSLIDFNKKPYTACSLRIRLHVVIPYIFPTANNNDTPVGFEDEFVKLIINNFANATLEYDMKNNVIGYVTNNFTTTNTLRDIQNGVIDGILGATILTHNRVGAFDFTTPHILDDIILTVPKAVKVEKWIVMFTLFKPIMWALIFATFVLIQMFEFVLKLCNVINSQGLSSPRYFIILWVLFTWYISVFYQSGLASIFTKPVFYHQINSVDELLEKDYKLFLNDDINIFAQDTKDLDLSSFIKKSRKQNCKNDLECMNIVASGGKKYALNSRLSFKFYGAKFHGENGEDKLYVLQDPYYHLLMTTYIKKGHPNIERIRFLERNVIASGLIQRSMIKAIHENKLKYYKLQSVTTKSLTCRDIAGLYYLFLCGCTLAMITFLCEVLVYRHNVF